MSALPRPETSHSEQHDLTASIKLGRVSILCAACPLPRLDNWRSRIRHEPRGRRGPSIPDMIALIREHMTARDLNRFLDAVIFNIAISNVDSHARNCSILLGGARPDLAPLYDLISGLAWQNITTNYAQEIGGQRNGCHVFGRHWRRLAEASGVSARRS